MAFPHPQSGKDNYRDRDEPNDGRVVRKFFKRTVNISDYRNGKDDVNPAKDRTFGGFIHDLICKAILSAKAATYDSHEQAQSVAAGKRTESGVRPEGPK